jgi:hypothetical protein
MRKYLQATAILLAGYSCKSDDSTIQAVDTPVDNGAVVEPAQPEEKFDIIDHSFLFPLPTSNGFGLKASGDDESVANPNPDHVILPFEQFERLPKEFLQHQGNGLSPRELWKRLYIVGFRYDPCFPMVVKIDPRFPTCFLRAVRLVGQFIDVNHPEASMASMHILFALKGPDTPAAADMAVNNKMINALRGLKAVYGESTKGVKLGLHPGFSQLSGPRLDLFRKTVKEIIWGFTGENNYFATSIFYRVKSTNGPTVFKWDQFINQVSEKHPTTKLLDLKLTTGIEPPKTLESGLIALDNLGNGTLIPGEHGANAAELTVNPEAARLPHIAPILRLDLADEQALTKGINAADFYENPQKVTIPAADCASCHVATQRRIFAESKLRAPIDRPQQFKYQANNTQAMDAEILAGMGQTPNANPDNSILINFGYHRNRPVISQRTVNEAAQITRMINEGMWNPEWTPTP